MEHPTIHVEPGPVQLKHEEGFLHYLAREGRVALRWIIGISMVATLMVMVSPFLFLAPIPALIMLVAYVLFVLTREVEKRVDSVAEQAYAAREVASEEHEVMENASEQDQVPPDTMRIVKREGITGVAIVACVLSVALVVAWFLLPWTVVVLGAFVVTAYMLLVAAPVLMGWISDDIEQVEAEQQSRAQPPNGPETVAPLP